MWPVRPNQKADSPVSTAPLSGIGVGCTTSYVEILSLATIRIRSPRSYISRTFPLAMSGRSVTGGTDPQATNAFGPLRARVGPGP